MPRFLRQLTLLALLAAVPSTASRAAQTDLLEPSWTALGVSADRGRTGDEGEAPSPDYELSFSFRATIQARVLMISGSGTLWMGGRLRMSAAPSPAGLRLSLASSPEPPWGHAYSVRTLSSPRTLFYAFPLSAAPGTEHELAAQGREIHQEWRRRTGLDVPLHTNRAYAVRFDVEPGLEYAISPSAGVRDLSLSPSTLESMSEPPAAPRDAPPPWLEGVFPAAGEALRLLEDPALGPGGEELARLGLGHEYSVPLRTGVLERFRDLVQVVAKPGERDSVKVLGTEARTMTFRVTALSAGELTVEGATEILPIAVRVRTDLRGTYRLKRTARVNLITGHVEEDVAIVTVRRLDRSQGCMWAQVGHRRLDSAAGVSE